MATDAPSVEELVQWMFYHEYLQLRIYLPQSGSGRASYRSRLYSLEFLQRLQRLYETFHPELMLFENYLEHIDSILPADGTPSLFNLMLFESTPSLLGMLTRRLLPAAVRPEVRTWRQLQRRLWEHRLQGPIEETLEPLRAAYEAGQVEPFRQQLEAHPSAAQLLSLLSCACTTSTNQALQKIVAGYLLSGSYRRSFSVVALTQALGEQAVALQKRPSALDLVIKAIMATAEISFFWKEFPDPNTALETPSLLTPLYRLCNKELLLLLIGLHSPHQLLSALECPFLEFEPAYAFTVEMLNLMAYRLHNLLPTADAQRLVSELTRRRALPYEVVLLLLRLGLLVPTVEHLQFCLRCPGNGWAYQQYNQLRTFKLLYEAVEAQQLTVAALLPAALDGGNEACLEFLWRAFPEQNRQPLADLFLEWSAVNNVYKGLAISAELVDPRYERQSGPQICSSYRWAAMVGLARPEQVDWLTAIDLSGQGQIGAPMRRSS